ncbi:uncharacterized protein YbjT (DUF2867 family) [Nocardiopsis sp. Huas11]|uniref:SDR family oxidoreductase n=1 Tax=Nocardiopsis sp. Huas11 TaxID=2183912 RepID=UPI000EB1FFB8|nr:SDR family oxidoreductase [Nocardiopsis sp. Huas11]RKS06457.1 uncharacterized protein YbjT (DUF2867 family) [Nocardiopsis sp. Huas11]
MESILVTGGTGTLGRAVVRRLSEEGREVRVLSRRAAPPGAPGSYRRVIGDLSTGAGLAAAVDGVGTIVHCATTLGRGDIAATRRLVHAVLGTSTGLRPHLIYVSIVGADTIPVPYYRAKLAAERVVADSGLPWSTLRTTQFHDLVAGLFARQRRLPLTLAPEPFRFQPIDTRDVAGRLADLAAGGAAGRVPDIGGPRVGGLRELAGVYNESHGLRRRVVSPRVPGGVVRAFADGGNLVPGNRFGTIAFKDFVAERVEGGERGRKTERFEEDER